MTGSSSRIASAIGMGKKNTSWNAVMISVFVTAFQNAESAMTRWKFSSPTNSLLRIPTKGE